jgi:hypothetical protein
MIKQKTNRFIDVEGALNYCNQHIDDTFKGLKFWSAWDFIQSYLNDAEVYL